MGAGGGGGSSRPATIREVIQQDGNWIVKTTTSGRVTFEQVNQPDGNRTVMGARVNKGSTRVEYYYTDRYPYYMKVVAILTVLYCILGTPLTLCCTFPAVILMQNVRITHS